MDNNKTTLDLLKRIAEIESINTQILEALKLAYDHLLQYQRYSDEMRHIGRGAHISSPVTPEYLKGYLKNIIAKAEGK